MGLIGRRGLDDFTFAPELTSKASMVSPEKTWDFPRSEPVGEWQTSSSKKHKSESKKVKLTKRKRQPREHDQSQSMKQWSLLSSETSAKMRQEARRSSSSSCSDSDSETDTGMPSAFRSVRSPLFKEQEFKTRCREDCGDDANIKLFKDNSTSKLKVSGVSKTTHYGQNIPSLMSLKIKTNDQLSTKFFNTSSLPASEFDPFTFTKKLDDFERTGLSSRRHINTGFIDQLVRNNAAANSGEDRTRHASGGNKDFPTADQTERDSDHHEWQKVQKNKNREVGARSKISAGEAEKAAEPTEMATSEGRSGSPMRQTSYQKLFLDIEHEFPGMKMDDIKAVIVEVKKSRPGGHFHGMLFSEIVKEVKSVIMKNHSSKLRECQTSKPVFRQIQSVQKKTEKKSEGSWQHPTVSTDKPFQANDVECCICLLDLTLLDSYLLDCGHTYHKKCIDKWVKHQGERTCPICRKMVLLLDDFPQLGSDSKKF